MKIHKINLENYYRNVIDSAIAVLSHLPEAVFAGRPTFNNALLRFNDGEAPVLMLPKWSDITIDLSQHKPSWAPASLTGTIKVSITPSVVGVEASEDETSLGSFDVYGVTGTSTGKQYEVTEGKYAIEYAVSILDGEDNPVVVFSNGQALKVAMVKDADNGPDTTLDIASGGGGSFTQEQADWSQSDDTAVDFIKNKPTIPAAQVNADWNAESGVAQILNKPTIPTVNDATLTFTQDGETLATFSANASTNVEVEIPAGGGGGGDLLVEKTWSELKAMRDGGTLVPGQQYRITDYVATTSKTSTSSANKPFDIIVTADSASKLNEHARAILHSGDTYFANCKLEAWKLWYCLDNDTTRFEWADSTNGKGVIYRMIDEWNNYLPFDFKGILKVVGRYVYPIFYVQNADGSLDGGTNEIHDNKIDSFIDTDGKQYLRFIQFFGKQVYLNTFGGGCNGTIGDKNIFNCHCNFNVVGTCTSVQASSLFTHNVIGPESNVNAGTGFAYNVVGQYSSIVCGVNCTNNVIGSNCKSIYFGPSSGGVSSMKDFYQNITIEPGNQYIYLNCTGTTSTRAYYQNVTIGKGVNTTDTWKTIADSNVNQAYQTTFFNEPDGTLKKQEGSTVTTYTPPA